MALTEKACSVCGKWSWDSQTGSYNETHPDPKDPSKTVKCDTNGREHVDPNG
jgi:hypothetical protein